jgi:predicted negative regulator of RcsB-dependent stress response
MGEAEVSTWASLLDKSPLIAVILALGIVVIYLWRTREKDRKVASEKYEALQAKYTEDLIKATEAMNGLATENLKQSFSDSAAWRDSVREFGDTLKQHMRDEADAFATFKRSLGDIKNAVERQN